MSMTKKDYEFIARILGGCLDYEREMEREQGINALQGTIGVFVTELGQDNPKFNKDKFLTACGIEIWCEICSNELATQTVNGEQVCSMCAELGHIED